MRKRIDMKRFLLTTAFMALSAGAQSQTLTVDSCRVIALQNNREKQMAALQTRQAELTQKSTRAQFLPDFSLSAVGLYNSKSGSVGIDLSALGMPLVDIDYKLGPMFTGGVQLTQPIYMGGKIRSAYSMSKTAVEMRRQNERLTDAEVIEQVDEAYAQVVKAEEMEQVVQRYRETLLQLDKNVESAVRHGLRHRNDRLKVQVRLNDVDVQQLRARNAITLSKMNLCRLLGRGLSEGVEVSHDYPAVDCATMLGDMDVSLRPEVAMLDGQLELLAQQVRQARSALLPEVALLARYGYTYGLELNNRTLLNGASFTGAVTVSVPLYHFGERQNKVRAAQLKQQEAQLNRAEKVELMTLELTQAAQNVEEAQAEVAMAQKSLEQAELNMRLSKQQYEAGFETLSDYLESQAQWQQASEGVVEAHFNLYLKSITLRKAAGVLVP